MLTVERRESVGDEVELAKVFDKALALLPLLLRIACCNAVVHS